MNIDPELFKSYTQNLTDEQLRMGAQMAGCFPQKPILFLLLGMPNIDPQLIR